jgi:hypothetical protein
MSFITVGMGPFIRRGRDSDAGAAISFEVLPAFNYFGEPETFKEFTMARPLLALGNNAAFSFGINTDFDTTQPLGVPTYTPTTAGKWDSGLWDVATWGGDPVIQKNWQTVSGTGYCACHAYPWFYFGRSDRVERNGLRLQEGRRLMRRICTGHPVFSGLPRRQTNTATLGRLLVLDCRSFIRAESKASLSFGS